MSRDIAGQTVEVQAIMVAGALAELGARDLVLIRGGVPEQFRVRHTDLPALLCAAPVGSRLECQSLGIGIEIAAAGLRWSAADPATVRRFAAALGQGQTA